MTRQLLRGGVVPVRARRIALLVSGLPILFLAWLAWGPADAQASPRARAEVLWTSPPPCENEIDDDGDSRTDYPDDPGCETEGDYSEDHLMVQTSSTLGYDPDESAFTGRLWVSESPRSVKTTCKTRELTLFERRPGGDVVVDRVIPDSNGRWRLRGHPGVNASFYLVIPEERTSHEFIESVYCESFRSLIVPIFTSAPELHPYCNREPATLAGTNGTDRLRGRSHPGWRDVIVAFEGNDRVRSGDGDDLVCGGEGADQLWGGGGSDWLVAQEGNDQLRGGGGSDWLVGGEGNDRLIDGSGDPELPDDWDSYWEVADQLEPGPGNDYIEGGSDHDYIAYPRAVKGIVVDMTAGTAHGQGTDVFSGVESVFGSFWDDEITGDQHDNRIRGGMGDDSLLGLAGLDLIFGDGHLNGRELVFVNPGDGHDILDGGTDADALIGEDGDDTLYGQEGDDHLMGWLGDDALDGGSDTDLLDGSVGTDSCVNGETLHDCEHT